MREKRIRPDQVRAIRKLAVWYEDRLRRYKKAQSRSILSIIWRRLWGCFLAVEKIKELSLCRLGGGPEVFFRRSPVVHGGQEIYIDGFESKVRKRYIDGRKVYSVRQLLSQGGFKTIYRLFTIVAPSEEAVVQAYAKPTPPEGVDKRLTSVRENLEEQIAKELYFSELLAGKKVPHVVQLSRAVSKSGRPKGLLMPLYVSDLAQLLKTSELPVKRKIEMIVQLSRALAGAHSCKGGKPAVCFLDLKPGNIFVDESQKVFIGDFGLAHVFEEQGENLCSYVGSWKYSAPEQVVAKSKSYRQRNRAKMRVTPAMDVWALGLVMIEIMHGHTANPFREQSFRNIVTGESVDLVEQRAKCRKQLQARFAKSPHPINALIIEMLNEDPNLRPTSCEVYKRVERLLHSC